MVATRLGEPGNIECSQGKLQILENVKTNLTLYIYIIFQDLQSIGYSLIFQRKIKSCRQNVLEISNFEFVATLNVRT